jgi:hypothetical protein
MPVRLTGALLAAALWCWATVAPAGAGSPYRPRIWAALGGAVTCGLSGPSPHHLLCQNAHIPPPPRWDPDTTGGDPGFVSLSGTGRPQVTFLSQYSWIGRGAIKTVAITGSRTWRIRGTGIACTIGKRAVRCSNRSRHGFTITRKAYRPF